MWLVCVQVILGVAVFSFSFAPDVRLTGRVMLLVLLPDLSHHQLPFTTSHSPCPSHPMSSVGRFCKA